MKVLALCVSLCYYDYTRLHKVRLEEWVRAHSFNFVQDKKEHYG